jgi:hypothetical protein
MVKIEMGTQHWQLNEPLANGPEEVQGFRFLKDGIDDIFKIGHPHPPVHLCSNFVNLSAKHFDPSR